MKDLVILRGLPGSGKSTLARLLAQDKWPSLSVDDYFTREDGSYHFVFSENHKAYESCRHNTEMEMKRGTEKIFLHNTFTLDWEIEPYFRLAGTYGYRVFVCTVENYHGSSNGHGISPEQLQKMADKYRVKLL